MSVRLTFLLLAAAASAAQAADWPLTVETASYEATLRPQDGRVIVGEFQPWVLRLLRADGSAEDRASIYVSGGMPAHGHGLPTQPQAGRYLGNGQYRIDGLTLTMRGEWVVAFSVSSDAGRDRLLFRFTVGDERNDRRATLASLYLEPGAKPPRSPGNRVADDPRAAALGGRLFFDPRTSADGTIACATCHQPDRFFTDGERRGAGLARLARNTPTIVGAGFGSWFYWDGRRDSLWAQALVPFEAAAEMGGSRLAVVRLIGTDPDYRADYEALFGAFPDALLAGDLPRDAGPLGNASMRGNWDALAMPIRRQVNAVYVNVGKSVAAFERTIPVPVTRFDRYVGALLDDDPTAESILTPAELRGLELFIDPQRSHCLRCHSGPLFTNGGFHNVGSGRFSGAELDFGRAFGQRAVLLDEFNCLGPYSDAAPDECPELRYFSRDSHVPLEGAFKVPGLRNVAATAPYMHDGRFADLAAVVDYYRSLRPDPAHELPRFAIGDNEAADLIAFLEALSAEP